MAISILLADDHEIFRQGLHLLLSKQPDFQVVGQAADGLEAVKLAEQLHPDVMIVDLMMPGLSGADVITQIKQRLPDCRVIVLSMHDDESYVVEALQNGASGFVLKESSTTGLAQAIYAAMAGNFYLSPPLTDRAIQVYLENMKNKDPGEYYTLTYREREIFHLSAEGLTGPQIADRLSISVRTVETHRNNLMQKLGLHSHNELVAYARKNGLIG
jgi:two-component system, NarL family, response regulator NreC